MPRIQQLLQSLIPNLPILHISFFDGIGTASQALKFLGANVIFTMSWETDPDCQAVLHHHHQPIQHGDITHLDRETLNLLIQPLVQDNPDIIILITTGPPCVPTPPPAPRHTGPTGQPPTKTIRHHHQPTRRLARLPDPVPPGERDPTS